MMWIWPGAAIMVLSGAATLARVEPFWSWNTPISVPGYLGFPAFAFECFTMYVFVRALYLVARPGSGRNAAGRAIAP